MDNKEIQRKRIMTYFIDAAKEIIKEEGVKGLSARKVGEKAGYSYATIYNYFKDINTLLTYCMLDYLEDCYCYITNNVDKDQDPKQQMIDYALAYFKYFADNPDVFQLVFLEDLGQAREHKTDNKAQNAEIRPENELPSINTLFRKLLTECAEKGLVPHGNIELLFELIGSSVHGKLMFYIKRRDIHEIDLVMESVRREIDFLIG